MTFGGKKDKAGGKVFASRSSNLPLMLNDLRSSSILTMISPVKQSSGDRMTPMRNKSHFRALLQIQSPQKNHSSPKKSFSFADSNTVGNDFSPPSAEKLNSPNNCRSPHVSCEKKMYSAILKNEILGMDITSIAQLDDACQLHSPTKSVARRLFDYSPSVEKENNRNKPGVSNLFGSPKFSTSSKQLMLTPLVQQRTISQTPYKMLDAPELADDFYLNLIHWSSQDCLAVGLGTSIYIWEASTSNVTLLSDLSTYGDSVTSVSWNSSGDLLAVGTKKGSINIWDVKRHRLIKSWHLHNERIGALSWNNNTITSGSRDRLINSKDLRSSTPGSDRRMIHHSQEVCGLVWSPNLRQLASGGNDNLLCVWDNRQTSIPTIVFNQHSAAVKAIGWSPHEENLLASGGGTVDRTIKFWNTESGTLTKSFDTGSQVCSLLWSKHSQEIVTAHGYSQNHISIWKYPQMEQIASLTGHNHRVLYLSGSPCGTNIVSGAGDESLRFWKVFEKPKPKVEVFNSLEPSFDR